MRMTSHKAVINELWRRCSQQFCGRAGHSSDGPKPAPKPLPKRKHADSIGVALPDAELLVPVGATGVPGIISVYNNFAVGRKSKFWRDSKLSENRKKGMLVGYEAVCSIADHRGARGELLKADEYFETWRL